MNIIYLSVWCIIGSLYAALYATPARWLVTRDWIREDFGYGYFVLPVVLYLIWEKRKQIVEMPNQPSWGGYLLTGIGILLYWLGELAGEYYTLYLSAWLVAVGLCWIRLGWPRLKVIVFPLALALSMFPPPHFLYNTLTLRLKLISTGLGVELIRLCGMSVYREGNVIDMGFTRLQVVDACSGLRYLFPLIIMALLLAYLSRCSIANKIVVVLSAVPISIVTNGLRIASVGILYQFFGPVVAEGFFHDFSGWFIFMLSAAVLYLELRLIKRFFPEQSERDSVTAGTGRIPATDAVQPASHSSGFAARPVWAIVLLGLTLVLSQGFEFKEKVPVKVSFTKFPMQVGSWSGARKTLEREYLEELELSDYLLADYAENEQAGVNLYIAYSASQRKGKSSHSPATCLPGGGWSFKESGLVVVPLADGRNHQVARVLMEKNGLKQVAYYWFPQRGRTLTNLYELKFYTFWDSLTNGRSDGALVRIITPVPEGAPTETADARLRAFIREIAPRLDTFIPGKSIT